MYAILSLIFAGIIGIFIYLYTETQKCLRKKLEIDKKLAIVKGRHDLQLYDNEAFFKQQSEEVEQNIKKAQSEEGSFADMIRTGKIFHHLKKAWEMPNRINALIEQQQKKEAASLTQEEKIIESVKTRFGDETVNPLFHVKLAKAMEQEPVAEEMLDIITNTK
jgi:uncharacterized membrane protein YraQ (UPF0718 family)